MGKILSKTLIGEAGTASAAVEALDQAVADFCAREVPRAGIERAGAGSTSEKIRIVARHGASITYSRFFVAIRTIDYVLVR